MTDFPTEKPLVARAYCPGCEPGADPLREILDVHWCDAHVPCRAGPDDVLATAQGTAYGGAEAGGDDNRRWCALIHRETSDGTDARARGDPYINPDGDMPSESNRSDQGGNNDSEVTGQVDRVIGANELLSLFVAVPEEVVKVENTSADPVQLPRNHDVKTVRIAQPLAELRSFERRDRSADVKINSPSHDVVTTLPRP